MKDPALSKTTNKSYVSSAFAFVVVFIVGLCFSYVWQSQQVEVKRSQANLLAQSYAFHLKNAIDHNLAGNQTLASLVHEFGGFTRWFPQVASSLHQTYPQVNNFALSPMGVVEQVYPLAGNESVIGFDQFKDIEQGSEAWRTLTTQKMTLAGPVALVQGGVGLIARMPILLEERYGGEPVFWGFSSIVIRLDDLLESIQFDGLAKQGFAYRLVRLDATSDVTITEYAIEEMLDPIEMDVSLPNVTWRLSISPLTGWTTYAQMLGYLLVSLILALIAARFVFTAHRIREQKQRLAELLILETEHANLSDQRLTTTLKAIPDPLIEIDADGVVLGVQAPSDELHIMGLFKVGEAYSAHLPDSVQQVLAVVLKEAKQQHNHTHRGALICLAHSDSKPEWFEISVVYSQMDETDPDSGHFVVMLRDVTTRQEAEQQQRIAATAFETQDGMLITDKDNQIIRVNSAFQRISGYREEEVLGKTPAILQSGRHGKEFYQALFAQLEEKGNWEGEIWNRRKDGHVYPEYLSISTVYDHLRQVSHYVATFKDITERKASEHRIRELNYYDSLTRLANRTLLLEEMTLLIDNKDVRQHQCALLFIDLDHFKDVNDVWGHNIGDQLLQEVATRLVNATRKNDMVARIGGDEFIVMLEPTDISQNPDRALYRASHVSGKVFKALDKVFHINGVDYQIAASIGIAVLDEHATDPMDVIKQAELAMYEAKASGRSRYCFYASEMQQRVLERVQLESDLRLAIDHQEFELHVQPQWNAKREMIGAEALIRWSHQERGMVSPAAFIPLAEETRLILPIGEWVLHQACRWLAEWRLQGRMHDFVMSVNVSAVQFSQDGFVHQVKQILKQYDVPANVLQLELTESMLAHDQQDIIAKMEALKSLGVLISLDDFGTGYSSLSYLHRLPIDQLKIDQSFVANFEQDNRNAALAESIINLGHNLGMEVIAEGVETDSQFTWLSQHHCDLFQGYGLGKPMTMPELMVLYQSSNCTKPEPEEDN